MHNNRFNPLPIIHYPKAKPLLILCDGGGSNSSRHYIFKEDLQKTANALGLEIRIAHYPPYTSAVSPGRDDSLQKAQGNLPIRSAR